jgi:excisionase family DNA binding protein
MTGRPYTPEQVARRGLTREEAAAYLGLSPQGFDSWVRAGRIPGPLPGTKRWDRKAIDAALDKLSGLAPSMEPSALEKWKAGRHARAS